MWNRALACLARQEVELAVISAKWRNEITVEWRIKITSFGQCENLVIRLQPGGGFSSTGLIRSQNQKTENHFVAVKKLLSIRKWTISSYLNCSFIGFYVKCYRSWPSCVVAAESSMNWVSGPDHYQSFSTENKTHRDENWVVWNFFFSLFVFICCSSA